MSESNTMDSAATAPRRARSPLKPRTDEVSVIEAAYWLGGTEVEWLTGLAQAAAPLLDEGWGIAASAWNIDAHALKLRALAAVGGPPGFSDAVASVMANAGQSVKMPLLWSGPCTSLSASGTAEIVQRDAGSQDLLRLGIQDSLTIQGVDSGRHCLTLSAFLPTPTRPSRRTVSRWSRVASHLAAGFRVRRVLAEMQASAARPAPFTGSEAIFTATGRLEYVEGAAEHARRSLAHAVLAVNRARGNLRADDPDAALDAWKGLIAGRWSLVDHIDTDGKRFLVARKNAPDPDGPEGLSLRERQVLASRARGLALKLIAYDLGLSIASVSKSLQTGMAKLGLSCEPDLVALFARQQCEIAR